MPLCAAHAACVTSVHAPATQHAPVAGGVGHEVVAHDVLSPWYVPPRATHAACVRVTHEPFERQHAPVATGVQVVVAHVVPSP